MNPQEQINEKGHASPGYVYAPWVVIPPRNTFHKVVDAIFLPIARLFGEKASQWYIMRMANRKRRYVGGEFSVPKNIKNKYMDKAINANYYSTLKVDDIADDEPYVPVKSASDDKSILY